MCNSWGCINVDYNGTIGKGDTYMTSGMKFFFGLAIVMLGIAMGLIVFSLWGPTPTSQPVEVNGVRTFTPGQGAVKPKKRGGGGGSVFTKSVAPSKVTPPPGGGGNRSNKYREEMETIDVDKEGNTFSVRQFTPGAPAGDAPSFKPDAVPIPK